MIKYLGSKRLLLNDILGAIKHSGVECATVADVFSGTSRVGHALKSEGYRVIANDINSYAYILAKCYVETDYDDVAEDAIKLIREFNSLPGIDGYFTETYCIKSKFFQPKNGRKIDAIRNAIFQKSLDPNLEAVLLTSLMEAADRVDSTTGVQMAYLKEWSARSYNDLELRLPKLLPIAKNGKSQAFCLDAEDFVKQVSADIFYVDPPYNQHSYLGNYHIWETLVRNDTPEVYGVACKRVDVRERKSPFNSKRTFKKSLTSLLNAIQAKAVVMSFSNEGFLSIQEVLEILAGLWGGRASVYFLEKEYKRYVGAQIGIYNLEGDLVGEVSHTTNKEYTFVAVNNGTSV